MNAIVHYARRNYKCLLHYEADYFRRMATAGERLKEARLKAGFETATEAAESLGLALATYLQHENGRRGFPASKAKIYARRFKVTPSWLLYGTTNDNDGPREINEDELQAMVELAIKELPAGVSLGDLPRLVASNLHEQLEQFQAAGGLLKDQPPTKEDRKGGRSPAPTTRAGPEESRTR